MIIFVSQRNDNLLYLDIQGNSIQANFTQRNIQICLNLDICTVISIDIPPLNKANRDILIKRRLPNHFPEPLEEWVWDSQQRGKETVVFMIRKTYLEQIQRDWGKSVSLISPALAIPFTDKKEVYQFIDGCGVDLFFCNGFKIDHSIHLPTDGSTHELIDEFLGNRKEPQEIKLLEQKTSLFLNNINTRHKQEPAVLLLFLLLIPVIYQSFSFYTNKRLQKEHEQVVAIRNSLIQSQPEQSDSLPWKNIAESLQKNQTTDMYKRLESLYPYFLHNASIMSLSINGNDFQIQAVGKNPLIIVEQLRLLPEVESINLYQSRDQQTQESFNLSGRFK